MNCKPGDLAVYVGQQTHFRGTIVRCVEFLGNKPVYPSFELVPMWRIDREIEASNAAIKDWFADKSLRPIRDPGDDATDETLLWKPIPRVKETA